MGTKINSKRAEQWVKKGAPEQALDFLGAAVDTLSKQAIREERIYKEKDMNEQATAVDEEVKDKKKEEEVTPVEIAPEDVTKSVPAKTPSVNDSVPGTDTDTPATPSTPSTPATTPGAEGSDTVTLMKQFEKGVADAILTAFKQYHEEVTAPMAAEIAELKSANVATVQKSVSPFAMVENVFMNASDFMPSAAVSAMLKKEFGGNAQSGDITVTTEVLEASPTIVKEQKITKSVGGDDNVFAGFE